MAYKKILLPVDGSDPSLRAATHASEIASKFRAEILLLHCQLAFPYAREGGVYAEVSRRMQELADELLEPYRVMLDDAGISYSDRVLEGRPVDLIAEVAHIEKIDLIVMGSRGHSEIEGFFLGSATHRVLYRAECPVLVIR
ncbi:MAG: universal stress protein [Desulfovibrionales bacterium]